MINFEQHFQWLIIILKKKIESSTVTKKINQGLNEWNLINDWFDVDCRYMYNSKYMYIYIHNIIYK